MKVNSSTHSYYNVDSKIITVEQRPFGSRKIQTVTLSLDELKALVKDIENKLA